MRTFSRHAARGSYGTTRNDEEAGGWRFKDAIRRLVPFLQPYRGAFFAGFVCIAFTNVFGVLSPLVLKYGIEDLEAGVTVQKLFAYATYIIILAVAAGIFRYLMRRIIISTSRKIEYDLRVTYYEHLQTLSPSFFDRQQTGDLMTRATSDIEAVRMIAGPAIMYSMDTLITFAFALSLMIILSVPLTLTVLAFAPVISAIIYTIAKRIHRYSLDVQNRYSELNAMTQEHLSGIRVIKAYCQETSERNLFQSLNQGYFSANMRLVKMQAAMFPLFYSIFGIGMALILYIGGKSIIAGSMTLGDFVAFSAYVAMLAWPVIAIGWVLNLFQRGSASMQRITKILDTSPEIAEIENDSAPSEMRGKIAFKDVIFTYPGTTNPVLKDINLEIDPGTSLGIIGPVGSGKTSLISLLPRLYNRSSGEILIDDRTIETWPLSILRREIAVVQQDSFLFSDKLHRNVLFVDPKLDNRVLREVADIAQLDNDVATFSDGYETWVGERGLTLSGGQKQRTSLARALATHPKVLILDDCFSAVDTNTEAEILQRLRKYLKNRTVIIIAHRISTIQWVDNIVFLKEGEIIERGTHNQLIAAEGQYYELYRKQLIEEEIRGK